MNTDKVLQKLELLKSGESLRFVHSWYGHDVIVKMNQQQNRIYIDGANETNLEESKLADFLLWDSGEWFIVDVEPHVEYVRVEHEGAYTKL